MASILAVPFSSAWREGQPAVAATDQPVAIADPFTPIYRRGDIVVAWMVVAHLILAAFLAPVYDTGRVAAIVGLGSAVLYYACMGFAGGRFMTRNVGGLVLQTFCALHIYQMRGLAEMHFFFFTAVTAMILYQDWRALWLGVLAIIAQHSLFSFWHNEGVHPGGMHFFEPDHVSLLKISFHFGIALVQVAFAAWCAHIWRSSTQRQFALEAANDRLRDQERELERSNDRLERRAASLEDQVRQSQKMDAVGRLAGSVAHDFNNLLMVIQAHAAFAQSPESELKRSADIEQIRRAADSGAQLTRQLLALGRREELSPSCVDLNSAVRDTLEMIKRVVGGRIEVSTVAPRELAGIWADPGQIQQILLNLVVNARDAMPDGGMLRLETANVAVGSGQRDAHDIPAGDYVMLAVQDTGIGMTDGVVSRIFEPFYTTKEPGRGTGLGLATVDGIVKQANGHIRVTSAPGMGTTFRLFFPAYRPECEAPDVAAPVGRVAIRDAHILVVENEPRVRAALCRTVVEAGSRCTEARSGAEALEFIRSDASIDLVVSDMVMPGMTGIALVSEIRRTRPELPVLILSGYSNEADGMNWQPPEGVGFIQKPVTPRELMHRIRQVLES